LTFATGSRLDEQCTPRARLAGVTRSLQDLVRGTLISQARADEIADLLSTIVTELAEAGTDDGLGELALVPGQLGRSQSLSPTYEVVERDEGAIRGTLRFTRFHLGSGGAAHGGSIALWGDDVLGRLAHEYAQGPARTAYLHVDYRALVPVDHPLEFAAWAESREGRKLHLRAEITVDGALAAEIDGLWIQAKGGSAA
jgi:acyl-coenzyme A thioesterase PaaI-like protein